MISTTWIRLLFVLALCGVWLWLHYTFDKKDAEGLTFYAILALGLLGYLVDRRYIAKRGEKEV